MNNGIFSGFGNNNINSSDLIKETIYTSGTGTHYFSPAAKSLVVVVGGGGGGGAISTAGNPATGGSGAETVVYTGPVFFNTSSVTYEVGAGGAGRTANSSAGNDGSRSLFGPILAMPGRGGMWSPGSLEGTYGGGGGISTDAYTNRSSGVFRIPGGASGASTGSGFASQHGGRAAGFPVPAASAMADGSIMNSGGSTGPYASGGGCSLLGIGGSGHNTAGVSGSGYGSGGGGTQAGTTSGSGASGIIIVREYL